MAEKNDFLSICRTGDLVAFSGKGSFSKIIKWKTKSEVSHVAMVLKTPETMKEYGEALIIESTTLVTLPDCKSRKNIKGIQMHPLSERIIEYPGDIWWYALSNPLKPIQEKGLEAWLGSMHSKEIAYDYKQAIGAGLDRLGNKLDNKQDSSRLFCSELVCMGYQHIGLLPKNINPSEQTPKEATQLPLFKRRVKIKNTLI